MIGRPPQFATRTSCSIIPALTSARSVARRAVVVVDLYSESVEEPTQSIRRQQVEVDLEKRQPIQQGDIVGRRWRGYPGATARPS
jgi:hypothetical protein